MATDVLSIYMFTAETGDGMRY